MPKIKINLLPWREQARKFKQTRFLISLGIVCGIALVCVMLIHFILADRLSQAQNSVNLFQAELSKQQMALTKLQQQKKTLVALIDQVQFLMNLKQKGYRRVQFLNEMKKIVPKTILLDRIDIYGTDITIEGQAQSDLDITLYMQALAASSLLKKPALKEISLPKVEGSTGKFFRLQVQIRKN